MSEGTVHPSLPASVLLVGCGRMGGALLKGWSGDVPVHVLDPNAPAGIPVPRVTDPADLAHLPLPAIVVLAVKPALVRPVMAGFRGLAPPQTLFVSIAAGIRLETLRDALDGDVRVARAMPNIAVASRRGATALCFSPGIEEDRHAQCEALFRLVGECILLDDEDLLDVSTAISGSGPAYFFRFAEALAAAGRKAGLEEADALRLAAATLAGAGSLSGGDRSLSRLREDVTSPGGTTAAALAELGEPLDALAEAAIEAAIARSRELAR